MITSKSSVLFKATLCSTRNFSSSNATQAKDKYKLLVVGGGSGGLTIASKLRGFVGANNVAVVDPSEWHCKKKKKHKGPWRKFWIF
jgi:threonine dehydrogenase-like Zn-dependent dehydrogenase